MGVTLVGPALLDLADQVGSNVNQLSSHALVIQAIFYTVTALGGGVLCRYVNRQWFLIVCILVCAATQIWTPFTDSLLMLTICLSVSSAFGGGIDVAANAWLLAIWRGGSTHLMQGLHFSWALGSAVAPLVMAPYLSVRNETLSENRTKLEGGAEKMLYQTLTSNHETLSNETQTSESEIYIIYYASGALYIILASIFIALYYFVPYSESNEKSDMADAIEDSSEYTFSKCASALIIGIAIVIICFDAGAEVSTFDYNTAFIVGLHFPKKTGAYISSARGFAFAAARAIAGFVAIKVSINIILLFSMFLLLGANFLLAFASMPQRILATALDQGTVETLLWIGFCMMGFGVGPIYPGTMSYTEKYVKLSDFTCGLFVSVGSINIILNLAVVGKYLEEIPIILIYNVLAAAIVMIVMFISLMIIVKRTAKPIVNEKNFTFRRIDE